MSKSGMKIQLHDLKISDVSENLTSLKKMAIVSEEGLINEIKDNIGNLSNNVSYAEKVKKDKEKAKESWIEVESKQKTKENREIINEIKNNIEP